MSTGKNLQRILDGRVMAIIRLDSAAQSVQVAQAIKAGGVDVIEFTMSTPRALDDREGSTVAVRAHEEHLERKLEG